MAAAGYATLWEFAVAPAKQTEFEEHYGPDGTWVQLFRRSNGYLGSELFQDRSDPLHYLTIDRWKSRDAWLTFRREHRADMIPAAFTTTSSRPKRGLCAFVTSWLARTGGGSEAAVTCARKRWHSGCCNTGCEPH